MVDYLLGGGERGSPYREDLQIFPKYLELTSSIQQYRLNSLRVVVSYERESGTEIGNFGEIRFRLPTSAQLSRAVKADLSVH